MDRHTALRNLRNVSTAEVTLDRYGLPILNLAERNSNTEYWPAWNRCYLFLNAHLVYDRRGKFLGSPHISEIMAKERGT